MAMLTLALTFSAPASARRPSLEPVVRDWTRDVIRDWNNTAHSVTVRCRPLLLSEPGVGGRSAVRQAR
jgi:hypothetical protein